MSKPKTFVEVWTPKSIYGSENFFAVRRGSIEPDGSFFDYHGWSINGTNFSIFDKGDVRNLRLLLDELEKELDEPEDG